MPPLINSRTSPLELSGVYGPKEKGAVRGRRGLGCVPFGGGGCSTGSPPLPVCHADRDSATPASSMQQPVMSSQSGKRSRCAFPNPLEDCRPLFGLVMWNDIQECQSRRVRESPLNGRGAFRDFPLRRSGGRHLPQSRGRLFRSCSPLVHSAQSKSLVHCCLNLTESLLPHARGWCHITRW